MDWDIALKEFITLWVVIDPIGTIPVFLAVTAGLSATQQRFIAIRSALIAGVILLLFIIGGQVLMEGLNIHLEAFQIAGGIVLFLFATTMIFGDGKPASEQKQFDGNISHLAVFPLAMPSLASPGGDAIRGNANRQSPLFNRATNGDGGNDGRSHTVLNGIVTHGQPHSAGDRDCRRQYYQPRDGSDSGIRCRRQYPACGKHVLSAGLVDKSGVRPDGFTDRTSGQDLHALICYLL